MSEDEDSPNHEIEPDDDISNEANLPIDFTFEPSLSNEIFIRAEYDEVNQGQLFYSVAAEAKPSEKKRIFYWQTLLNNQSYF